MKVPLRNRPISSVVDGLPDDTTPFHEIKIFDYAHDEPLLGEIAGHVFNRHLRFRKEKTALGRVEYEFRLGSTNPTKAALYLRQYVEPVDLIHSHGGVEEAVYESACEELLFKALEAIDKVHKLDNNFFDRLKFVFKGK